MTEKEVKTVTDELLELNGIEANNFLSNHEDLGKGLEALDALSVLFDEFYSIFYKIITHDKRDGTTFAVLINLFQLMRQDLRKGMLVLCRGYVTDASFHVRRILETVAILLELIKEGSKVPVYVNLEDEKGRKKYIDKFKIFYLTKAHLSATSMEHYEMLCFNVHPSALVTADRGAFNENRQSHELSFFDINSDEDAPRLRRDFLIALLMMFEALKSFGTGLATEKDFDSARWEELSTKYHLLWQKHAKDLIASNELPTLNEHLREFHAEQQAKQKEEEAEKQKEAEVTKVSESTGDPEKKGIEQEKKGD